jgi:hypothetical protein
MSITITFPVLFALVFVVCLFGWLRTVKKSETSSAGWWDGDLYLFLLSFLWWIPVLVMIGVAIGRAFR